MDYWQVQELFNEALGLPPAERDAYVRGKCAGNEPLQAEVLDLLKHADEAKSFMEASPAPIHLESLVPPMPQTVERSGDLIGPYRLDRILGEGTYGTVWLAARQAPYAQTVAVKIIKPGMDSAAVVARFEMERYALGVLNHPHVAMVMDGGLTPTGRPYFVMEYVDGTPITQYADEHKLGLSERLRLFSHVCSAVQHAHSKGIIHRDLKPSNILVTTVDGSPVPKVIDFGVSKSLESPAKPFATHHGQMLGTKEYMSPEQGSAGEVDVDTRTDVYSLGVVLYQLLTGWLPFDSQTLRAAAAAEVARIIREETPVKPSDRVADRAVDSPIAWTSRQLRGDLDWIVMRCLEKDRARRYETPAELERELNRFLRGEAVLAGPPSVSYRLKKFVTRNRGTVLAAALVALTMLAGVAGIVWKARETARQRDEAQQSRDESVAIVSFVEQVFLPAGDSPVDIRESLSQASDLASKQFRTRPGVEAGIRGLLGALYAALGDYGNAEVQLSLALELRRQHSRGSSLHLADNMLTLASVYRQLARFDDSEALMKEALRVRERQFAPGDWANIAVMVNLAQLYNASGRPEKAEPVLRDALRRTVASADDEQVWRIQVELCTTFAESNRAKEAEPILLQVVSSQTSRIGENHPDTLETARLLAEVYARQNKLHEAEQLYDRMIPIAEKRLGAEHPMVLAWMNGLAGVYIQTGRVGLGIQLMRETLAVVQQTLPPGHMDRAFAEVNLAMALLQDEQYAEAEPLLLSAHAAMSAYSKGDATASAAEVAQMLAGLYRATGRPDEARAWADRSKSGGKLPAQGPRK